MTKAMLAYAVVLFASVFLLAVGGYVTLSILVDPILTARGVMDGE